MRRALVVALASWLFAVAPGLAQDQAKLPLVGVLRVNTVDTVEPMATMFRNALAALGRIDDRNIRLETRLAEGHAERLPELARSLARENPAVMVAFGEAPIRAAQQATSIIPIIGVADDLVEAGLISSLAKPGGNTTGVSIFATELDAKRIEILKEFLPAMDRVGVLRDPATSAPARMEAIAKTAQKLGVELVIANANGPGDFAPAFGAFQAGAVSAVDVLSSPMLHGFRAEIVSLSLKSKLPVICQFREGAEAGCLASYGVRLVDLFSMAADLTHNVLKGAEPGATPARQPTKFELVINMKTAQALGLTVPHSIRVRADEVIE